MIFKKGYEMYFTNIKGLKKDIVEKKFGEKDRFLYIVVSIMISVVIMELISLFPTELTPTLFDYANSTVSIFSTFLGTYFIYKANGGEKGEDFAGRYFSIIWVRSIQFLVPLIPILIVYEMLNQLVLQLSPFNNELFYFIIFSGYLFGIYLYAYRDVLEIKAEEKV